MGAAAIGAIATAAIAQQACCALNSLEIAQDYRHLDSAGVEAADAAGNRLKVMKPIQEANGTSHTTIKRDPKTGKVSNYETWEPNPKNPTGYDSQKRVDTQHAKPHSHGGVDTPHVHEKGSKMPRPALPTELPK